MGRVMNWVLIISLLTSVNTGLLMWMLARGDTRGWYLSLFVAQPLWVLLIVTTQAWGLAPLTTWMTYVAVKGIRRHRAGGVMAELIASVLEEAIEKDQI